MTLLFVIALLIVLICMGVPIAIAMLATTLVYAFLQGLPPEIIVQQTIGGVDDFVVVAIPCFILMGNLMNAGGVTHRIVEFAMACVGRFRGGLAHVNVGSGFLMACMSGSAVADSAAIGSMLIPEMKKRGYSRGFAAALTGAVSMIAPILPPSINLIVYASIAGVSVGAMFLAGVVPGVLLAITFAITVAVIAWIRKWPRGEAQGWKVIAKLAGKNVFALAAPVLVVGGIVSGIFTPTEAAAVACVYVAIIGAVVYRELTWSKLPRVLKDTVISSSVVLIVIGTTSAVSWILTLEGATRAVLALLGPLADNHVALLLAINLGLLILGILIEPLPLILLATPILLPAVTAVGIDPVHFGLILVINIGIGMITPPVGGVMFVVSRISGATMREFTKASTPFFIALAAVLLLVTFIPQLSTGLGTLLGER